MSSVSMVWFVSEGIEVKIERKGVASAVTIHFFCAVISINHYGQA